MKKFFVTTAVGGMLFLIPLVVVTLIIGKAFKIMIVIAGPIAKIIPVEGIAGIGLINILAILIMLLVCLITGLIAKSRRAQSVYNNSDGILAELVPSYTWIKTVMKNIAGKVDTESFKPILLKLDDQTQIAFEMERGPNNQVVVFIPGAPDVRSGSVAYVTEDRVEPLAASFLTINKTLKHMGQGAAALLPKKQ
jgi:uncharacterized membrane protein